MRIAAGQSGFEKGVESVVMVKGRLGGAETFGAGIVFARSPSSLSIVTANHVVRRGPEAAIGLQVSLKPYPNRPLPARLLPQADAEKDVAVLVVDDPAARGVNMCAIRLDLLPNPDVKYGVWGPRPELDLLPKKRGDPVYPVGNPNGVPWGVPVAPDLVADITGGQIVFQSSAIARGHSGGGLLSKKGGLLGMIQADEPPYGRAISWSAVAEILTRWSLSVHVRKSASEGWTPLFDAAADGPLDDVKDLLSQPCVDINARDGNELSKGLTPLHYAALTGRTDVVNLLLNAGAQLNIVDQRGTTALGRAAENGHLTVMSALIARGADVNAGGSFGRPLYLAVSEGVSSENRLRIVELLLAHGARPPADGIDIIAALSHAQPQAKVQEDIVRELIRAGANINARDSDGYTPLSLAVSNGEAGCVSLLLEAGAKVDVKDRRGQSLLRLAAQAPRTSDQAKVAVLLLQHGAKAEGEDRTKLLARATEDGWTDVLKYLNFDPKIRTDWEALSTAVGKGWVETVKAMLDSGASPNGSPGNPPLQIAVRLRDPTARLQMAQLLVLRGAKVNLYPPDTTYDDILEPLYEAVSAEPPNLELVRFLIAHGARVTQAAILAAEHYKHPDIAQLLRESIPKAKQTLPK
jgi:ankyrin repeat protein